MAALRPAPFNPTSNLGSARRKNDDRPICPDCRRARMELRTNAVGPDYWECNKISSCQRRIYFEVESCRVNGQDKFLSRRLRPMFDWPAAEEWRGPFDTYEAAIRGVVS